MLTQAVAHDTQAGRQTAGGSISGCWQGAQCVQKLMAGSTRKQQTPSRSSDCQPAGRWNVCLILLLLLLPWGLLCAAPFPLLLTPAPVHLARAYSTARWLEKTSHSPSQPRMQNSSSACSWWVVTSGSAVKGEQVGEVVMVTSAAAIADDGSIPPCDAAAAGAAAGDNGAAAAAGDSSWSGSFRWKSPIARDTPNSPFRRPCGQT